MIYTVIPTFFTEDNKIDIESILLHIEYQIKNGIPNIVIHGTTSEACTLSLEERIFIATTVKEKFDEEINLVIGISGNNTKDVVDEVQIFNCLANCLMVSAPYYNKPSQEGLYQHFKSIFDSTERKDYIIYNVPSRCGVNIEPETISRLFKEYPMIKGIKEASGSVEQVIKIRSLCNIKIYSGDDALTIPFMSLGAEGVISVVSNIVPFEMKYIVDNFMKGDIKEANITFYKIYNLIKLCFIESNPVPVKYMINKMCFYKRPNVRLPLVELTDNNKLIINKQINTSIDFKEFC